MQNSLFGNAAFMRHALDAIPSMILVTDEDARILYRNLLKKAEGLKIAVMGCVVNGPGEARSADFGVAGGKGRGIWIENGKQMKVIKEAEWVNEVIRKIRSFK